MSSVTLANLFRVETDKPDLLQAQVKALSKQIPLLLFITVVNTLAVAATHYGTAPYFLTVGFPLVVTIGYAWHGLDWAKLAFRPLSDRDAGRLCQSASKIAPGSASKIDPGVGWWRGVSP